MSQTFTDDCFASGHVAQTDMQNIENNFAAVKSSFSGSSAPSNPVAGMPWFDTDTDQMYLRNKDNDQWLSLGFAPGTIMLFGQTTAPLGWTRKADWQDNAMLCYAASGSISSGGSVNPQSAHSHGLGTIQVPAHNHQWYNYRDGLGEDHQTYNSGGSAVDLSQNTSGVLAITVEDSAQGLGFDSYTNNQGATSLTGTLADNTAPYFQEVIACTKD